MAIDKAVDSGVLDAGLKLIADAIREKGGTEDTLAFPQAMADAIAAIESGGGIDLSNCQSVISGEVVPNENISSNYLIHSGVTVGEIGDYKKVGFVLFDTTIGSSLSEFTSCIMAAYFANISPTLTVGRGFYRNASGSNVSLTSSSVIGSIANENGEGVFGNSFEICFNIVCATTKMLLAGHSYCYMFFARK